MTWVDVSLHPALFGGSDADGYARPDEWITGSTERAPIARDRATIGRSPRADGLQNVLDTASAGEDLAEDQIVRLFSARGDEFHRVCAAADALRARVCGDRVTYVVNRNINYTNICYFRCKFALSRRGSWRQTCAASLTT